MSDISACIGAFSRNTDVAWPRQPAIIQIRAGGHPVALPANVG